MSGYIIKTIKELLSSKKNLIFFIITVLIVGALALTAGSKPQEETEVTPNITIGVVDHDNSFYSKLILNYFKNTDSITKFANIIYDTQKNMEVHFDQGKLLAYLVIPQNFSKSLMGAEYITIDVNMNTSNMMYSVLLKNILDSYGTYITNVQVVSGGLYRLGGVYRMGEDARNKMNVDTSIDLVQLVLNRDKFFMKNEVLEIPSTPIQQYYIWAILVLFILLTASLSGNRFLKERQMRTFDRLRIAGHSIYSITATILIMNAIIWMLCFNLLLQVVSSFMHCNVSFGTYLYIDLCILLANMFFLFISILCSNSQQYAVICTFGLILLSIIGGILIPISLLPEQFLLYSRLTPTFYIIQNLIKFGNGTNLINIGCFTLIMIFTVLLLYGLSCFILRHQDRRREIE